MACIQPNCTHPYFPLIYIQMEIYNTHSNAHTSTPSEQIHVVIPSLILPRMAWMASTAVQGSRLYFSVGGWHEQVIRRKQKCTWALAELPLSLLEVVNLLIAGQTHTTDLTRKTVFWMGFFSVSPFLFPFCIPNLSLDSHSQSSKKWVLENPNWRRVSSYLHITHRNLYNPGFLIFH